MQRSLPVDGVLASIVDAARAANVVVTAPPGSGKTTRVPPALAGRVVVVEPRRLATRMAATWVAEERGSALGAEVGYQVRFESRCGPDTRVVYVTEGVLARRLVDDPLLRGVDCVVLDEFHERHLHADVALAMLRRLQLGARPDLRLVAMSATLDAAPLASYLGGCPVLAAEGRLHAVEIEYDDEAERPLETRVAAALRRALDREEAGDVLVFLPGAAEIRRALEACAGVAGLHDADLVPLHGDLPLEAQSAAVRPGRRRRVILSTNVAESSITVEGVTVVIDSGLARRASTSPWSGLDEIRVEKISRASADQRAGRAGRVRPGRCVRLFARHDYERRPAHEVAEIHRVDLSETLLLLHGAGIGEPASLPWFEPLSAASVEQAERLLAALGAVEGGALTAVGRRMLPLPLHPRLARLVVEAERRGVAADGCAAAALLSERDIRLDARVRLGRGDRRVGVQAASSDVVAMIEAYRGRHGVDPAGARRVAAVEQQLRRALGGVAGRRSEGDVGLLKAVLVAWPDRVARRRGRDRASELLLSGGGTAKLADGSVVREADWMVAVDAEVRAGTPLVRVASEIELDWLLDLFIERVVETDERVWNDKSERVEAVRRMLYDRLVLDETRGPAPRDEATAALLADAALKAGAAAFADAEAVASLLHRVAFLAQALPEAGLAPLDDDDVRSALRGLCAGAVSFAEVRAGGLVETLQQRLPPAARRLLERAAPTHVALSARRRVAVHYEPLRPPWIASRLQDFFGLREGPRVGEGRVPLVLHLLAPNQRPVQVTTDLAGFWVRHYPQVRKELARRYPRHAWPEDPLSG